MPSLKGKAPPELPIDLSPLIAKAPEAGLDLKVLCRALDAASGHTRFHDTHPWYEPSAEGTPGGVTPGLGTLPRPWDKTLMSSCMEGVLSLHALRMIDEQARSPSTPRRAAASEAPPPSPPPREPPAAATPSPAKAAAAAAMTNVRPSTEAAAPDAALEPGPSAAAAAEPKLPPRALVEASMGSLRTLSLCGVSISDAGLQLMAEHARQLVDLDLSFVGVASEPSSAGAAPAAPAGTTGSAAAAPSPGGAMVVAAPGGAAAPAAPAAPPSFPEAPTAAGLHAVLQSCAGLTRLSLAGAAPSLFFADGPAQLAPDGAAAWPAAAPALRVLDLTARGDLRPSQLARIHACCPSLAALRLECVLSTAHVYGLCLGFVDAPADDEGPPHAQEADALEALIAKERSLTALRGRLKKSSARALECLELIGANGSGVRNDSLEMLSETFGSSLTGLDLIGAYGDRESRRFDTVGFLSFVRGLLNQNSRLATLAVHDFGVPPGGDEDDFLELARKYRVQVNASSAHRGGQSNHERLHFLSVLHCLENLQTLTLGDPIRSYEHLAHIAESAKFGEARQLKTIQLLRYAAASTANLRKAAGGPPHGAESLGATVALSAPSSPSATAAGAGGSPRIKTARRPTAQDAMLARSMAILKGKKISVVVGAATHARPYGAYDREADELVSATAAAAPATTAAPPPETPLPPAP